MISPLTVNTAKQDIRAKVLELAARRGRSAQSLGDTDIILETGLLDSAAILELVLWCESRFNVTLDEEDLTLNNFGTVKAMAEYLVRQ